MMMKIKESTTDFSQYLIRCNVLIRKIASAGNRTRVARVAGEHSTTEPPMLIFISKKRLQFYTVNCGAKVGLLERNSRKTQREPYP